MPDDARIPAQTPPPGPAAGVAPPDPFQAPAMISQRPPRPGLSPNWVPLIPIALALTLATIAGQWPRRNRTYDDISMQHSGRAKPASLAIHSPAPDFSLRDAHDLADADRVTLSQLTATAPVLLIFYQSYDCSRCVLNLHDISDHKDDFDKAGLQIVAISADAPDKSRESAGLFGDFPFPLLFDEGEKTARAYGLFDEHGSKLHAAFIVDKHRRIRLAETSEHPYDDLEKLLALGHQLQQEK